MIYSFCRYYPPLWQVLHPHDERDRCVLEFLLTEQTEEGHDHRQGRQRFICHHEVPSFDKDQKNGAIFKIETLARSQRSHNGKTKSRGGFTRAHDVPRTEQSDRVFCQPTNFQT
jgi:hypothetical protein